MDRFRRLQDWLRDRVWFQWLQDRVWYAPQYWQERVRDYTRLLRSGPSLLAVMNAIQDADELIERAMDTGDGSEGYAESPEEMLLEARAKLKPAEETLRAVLF